MNILVVTEVFLIGGLETNIAGEIRSLIKQGHSVYLAVGKEFDTSLIPSEVTGIISNLDLNHNIGSEEFSNTINSLRKYIRHNNIELLHAQPFYSIIISAIVAELENKALVLTLHGPVSFANYFSPIFKFLLTDIILPNVNIAYVVSAEMKELSLAFSSESNVQILPNGIELTQHDERSIKDERWVCVSRLDEQKIVGVLEFIKYAKAIGLPGVVIMGDGHAKGTLEQEISANNLSNYVEFAGYESDVRTAITSYSGVAGMGRVVLEGIAAKRRVILVGYDGVKAVLNPETFEKAAWCNFSGRNFDTITTEQLKCELSSISDKDLDSCYDIINDGYNVDNIWLHFSSSVACILNNPFSSTDSFLRKIYSLITTGDVYFPRYENLYFSDAIYALISQIIFNINNESVRQHFCLLEQKRNCEQLKQNNISIAEIQSIIELSQKNISINADRLYGDFDKRINKLITYNDELIGVIDKANAQISNTKTLVLGLEEKILLLERKISEMDRKNDEHMENSKGFLYRLTHREK